MPVSAIHHDRFMTLKISDRSKNTVFEGRVTSSGTSSDIAAVLPAVIDSMFTGFPGQSGKFKRVENAIQ
jgi:hypothetical protein